MRARLLADFSIVLMLSVLYFYIDRGDYFFKSLLMYCNELYSTYLVLSLFFSISLWLPRVWIYSRAKCFYSNRRKRFSLSNVCMSSMCVRRLGKRQISGFILSPKLPFRRLRAGLQGRSSHQATLRSL